MENLDEVEMEFKRNKSDNPVDYSSFILRTPRLFVEAKALGASLDDRRWANQIMSYAMVCGVEWIVLTDGDEYRIYNSHATVPFEEKLFRSTRISGSIMQAAETLRLISKEHVQSNLIDVTWETHYVDSRVSSAVERLFGIDPNAGLVDLVKQKDPKLSVDQVKAGLSRLRISLEKPADPPQLEGFSGDKTPSHPFSQPGHVDSGKTIRVELPSAISARPRKITTPSKRSPNTHDVRLRDLIETGILQAPLDLEAMYKGQRPTARVIREGLFVWQGQSFETLSAAANAARASILGYTPSTNGWVFWQFVDDQGRRRTMSDLRERFYRSRSNSE